MRDLYPLIGSQEVIRIEQFLDTAFYKGGVMKGFETKEQAEQARNFINCLLPIEKKAVRLLRMVHVKDRPLKTEYNLSYETGLLEEKE